MGVRKLWLVALAAGLLLTWSSFSPAQDYSKYLNDYMGKTSPELESEAESWFNTDGKALTLKGLSDKVVYIEFSFIH